MGDDVLLVRGREDGSFKKSASVEAERRVFIRTLLHPTLRAYRAAATSRSLIGWPRPPPRSPLTARIGDWLVKQRGTAHCTSGTLSLAHPAPLPIYNQTEENHGYSVPEVVFKTTSYNRPTFVQDNLSLP